MIVKETKDQLEIEKILFDPEIYQRIKSSDNDKLPKEGSKYIGGYINDEIFAVALYISKQEITTCHIQVLKTHRAAHAVRFARKALELREDNILYTSISDKFPDTIRFAEFFGFKNIKKVGDRNIFRLDLTNG